MRLFGKTVRVTIAGLKTGVLTVDNRPANAVEIERLQIRFDVKKNLTKTPNKCVVKITGLAPDTRAQISSKPLRLLLHAGYDGVLKLLFDGDVSRSFSERDGATDVVTEIHVADGGRTYNLAHLVKSYRPPVSLGRVLTDAADSMALTLPIELRRDPQFNRILESGFSSSGPTREALSTLLEPLGYSWSSQNRQLVVLRDLDIRPGQNVLINQSTGLIGSPKIKQSDKAGAKSELTLQSLLYPEIVPGCGATVQSEFLNQEIKVDSVGHKGDTHSDDWMSDVKGTPL